jgi:DNA-binding MarR family transcriptional regulator
MRRAHVDFGYSLKEIGDFLGIHYATVSRMVKKVEEEMAGSKTPA